MIAKLTKPSATTTTPPKQAGLVTPPAPPYCPLPARVDFDYDTPYRDKLGIWKGTWDSNGRKFCVIITSVKAGEAQGIYSYDSLANSPGGWRQVRGPARSTQPGGMTAMLTTSAANSPVIMVEFRRDGTVRANWTQAGERIALSAWVTKVR
jgi:hypothetical protein